MRTVNPKSTGPGGLKSIVWSIQRLHRFPLVYASQEACRGAAWVAWVLVVGLLLLPTAYLVFNFGGDVAMRETFGFAIPVWLFFAASVTFNILRPDPPFVKPFFSKDISGAGLPQYPLGDALSINFESLVNAYATTAIEDMVYLFKPDMSVEWASEGTSRVWAFCDQLRQNLPHIGDNTSLANRQELAEVIVALSSLRLRAAEVGADMVLVAGHYWPGAPTRGRFRDGFFP